MIRIRNHSLLILLCVVICTVVSARAAGISQWKNIYGTFNSVAVSESGKIIAVGIGGRISFSNNAGHDWRSMSVDSQVECLSVCFLSDSLIAICTKDGRVVLSNDDALSWFAVDFTFDVTINSVSANKSGALLISSNRALYVRNPDGFVYNITTPDSDFAILSSCISDNGTMYAYCADDVLHVYFPQTKEWEVLGLPQAWTNRLQSGSPVIVKSFGTSLSLSGSTVIIQSYDGGSSWSRVVSVEQSISASCTAMGSVYFATLSKCYAFRYQDSASYSIPFLELADPKISTAQKSSIKCMAANSHGLICAVGTNNVIIVSNNYGSVFEVKSYMFVPLWINMYAMSCHKYGLIGYRHFYTTSNDGATWRPEQSVNGVKEPTDAQEAYVGDSNTVYLRIPTFFQVLKSTDGGIMYDSLLNLGAGSSDSHMTGFGKDTVLFVENVSGTRTRSMFSRTTDGGRKWLKLSVIDSTNIMGVCASYTHEILFIARHDSYYVMDSISGKTIYVSPPEIVYRSGDLVSSSSRVDIPDHLEQLELFTSRSDEVFLRGYDTLNKKSKVYHARYPDLNWVCVDSVVGVVRTKVRISDHSSSVLIARGGTLMYRATKDGAWRVIDGSAAYGFGESIVSCDDAFVILCGLQVDRYTALLVAYIQDLLLSVDTPEKSPENELVEIDQPFPNPGYSKISFNMHFNDAFYRRQYVHTGIYDIRGVKIIDLDSQIRTLPQDGGLVSIDVTGLADGAYWIKSAGLGCSVSRCFVKE